MLALPSVNDSAVIWICKPESCNLSNLMSSELPDSEIGPAEVTPTLSAVAKRAGVSSITVSGVVRRPDLVAPETRARVERAMRELDYEIGRASCRERV